MRSDFLNLEDFLDDGMETLAHGSVVISAYLRVWTYVLAVGAIVGYYHDYLNMVEFWRKCGRN